MKNLCIIALVAALFFTCSRQTVGTETEVNTGSIFGQLRTDGKKSDDTATVYLYCDSLYEKPVNPAFDSIQTVTYDDGIYQFDSLPDGLYHIEVLRDDIIIGNKSDVEIINDDIVEVNIELSVIINQTFNILIDQSTNITVNNVTINNGRIEKSDSGYVLTSIKTDTLVFTIEITREDDTDTVHVRIIRNGDGTVSFEIVENDVEIIVVDSDKSKPGVATITIGKPGTVEVEARFKENSGLDSSLLKGLVAYYPFNGNADDESGNGNDGTVNGATLAEDRFGNGNSALSFNGIDNFIAIPSFLSNIESGSISAWVYLNSIEDSVYTFFSWYNSPENRGSISYNGPKQDANPIISNPYSFTCGVRKGGNWYSNAYNSQEVTDSQFIHVVTIFNGSNITIYANSVKGESDQNVPFFWSGLGEEIDSVHIGKKKISDIKSIDYFHGLIDDIRIYNRALTEKEVEGLYHENGWTGNP